MNNRALFRPIQQTRLIISIAGALSLWSAGTTIAQVATSSPVQPTASPTATPAPAAQSETVDRIVVTAEKREQNIREVPASITAFNDVQLDNLHADDLTDYAAYVPGLQVDSDGAPGRVSIALRGITTLSSGSTVGTYIDETPVGSSGLYAAASTFQLDLLPYDIRRVEILRGPQGTLYGANSIGGLIKYVTMEPSLTEREFHLGGGLSGTENADDPGWDVHAVANIPIVQDRLAVRASYSRNELAGFIDNVANGQKDINDATQQTGHFSLLWKPSDEITVRLDAFGQRIESDNYAAVALDPVTERPLYGDLKNRVDVNEPFKKDIGLISLTVDWDFKWATLTSATSYSYTDTKARQDTTLSYGQFPLLIGAGPAGISAFDAGLTLQKFTQELRLTSGSEGPFLWQLGGFYTHEDANQTQFLTLDQLDGTPYPGLGLLADIALPSTYKEEAVFANASYKFTHWFSLGAGLRYSHNDQTFSQDFNAGAVIPLGKTPGSSSEDIVNFMVTPQFQMWKEASSTCESRAAISPAAQTSLFRESHRRSPPLPFSVTKPDLSLITSTTGSYSTSQGINLMTDIQVPAVVNNIGVLANGGQATSNGVELSLGVRPITGLELGLNGSYTDATFDMTSPLSARQLGSVCLISRNGRHRSRQIITSLSGEHIANLFNRSPPAAKTRRRRWLWLELLRARAGLGTLAPAYGWWATGGQFRPPVRTFLWTVTPLSI